MKNFGQFAQSFMRKIIFTQIPAPHHNTQYQHANPTYEVLKLNVSHLWLAWGSGISHALENVPSLVCENQMSGLSHRGTRLSLALYDRWNYHMPCQNSFREIAIVLSHVWSYCYDTDLAHHSVDADHKDRHGMRDKDPASTQDNRAVFWENKDREDPPLYDSDRHVGASCKGPDRGEEKAEKKLEGVEDSSLRHEDQLVLGPDIEFSIDSKEYLFFSLKLNRGDILYNRIFCSHFLEEHQCVHRKGLDTNMPFLTLKMLSCTVCNNHS